ncbi:MAG: phosphodiester glycosidase family protein [Myxococcota bacterium]
MPPPSITAPAHDAIAAINAGFFDTGPGTRPSLDLVKVAGVVASYNHLNGSPRRSFGLTSEGAPIMAWVDADRDWPDAWHAIGSYLEPLTDGAVAIEPEGTSSFFVGRNPRTALGLTADGKLLLVVVDGRTDAGVGMTLPSLAQHLVDLGAVQAVNLDGGGSSAMWIRDQSVNGIVNSPSDDGDVDHGGERGVSDLLLVVPR